MIKEMNGIVETSLISYEAYVQDDFKGFSSNVKEKIVDISKISWNSNVTGNVLIDAQNVGSDYVKSKIKELKSLVNNELILYADASISDFELNPNTLDSDPNSVDIDFDPNLPLIPIDNELSPMPSSDVPLVILDKDGVSSTDIPQIDNDVADKMLALMSSNNKLIEKISEEMALMRISIEEMRREGEERDKAMYEDLNAKYLALKNAISQLQKEGNPDLNFANTQAIENKENVEIKFAYASVYLSAENKVELNKVFNEMLRNPNYKLIITGYADQSGNKEKNILLSQRRAKEVKNHLIKMGISSNRMVVNYLGDSSSSSNNPDDRKVVIEWLEEVNVFGE